MLDDKVNINWGYNGKADFLLGTGATSAEQMIGWFASLMGASLYGYLYLTHALNWTWWQYILAGLLSFDVIGGIVANSLNSCKRFYHTAAKSDEPQYTTFFKNHLAFSALHIHTLLIAILFGAPNYFFGVFWYLFNGRHDYYHKYAPLSQKTSGILGHIISVTGKHLCYFSDQGFEWLVPALLIKILYGHLVKEEPYRPLAEKSIL